jgi:peptidyl-prolyl cis-trans isomerase A (cyclophilin A)
MILFLQFAQYFHQIKSSETTHQVNVQCRTTKGDIILSIYPEWAPKGAQRFLDLVNDNFFTGFLFFNSSSHSDNLDIALYRCVPNFLTQFGISDNPEKKHWHNEEILDDPKNKPILKHYISYAGGGPNTRSTQLFIAFEDLDFLGKSPWEVPFGEVTSGGDVVDSWYTGYGDMPPWGKGPDQGKLHNRGNQYIRSEYPLIDFILDCSVLEEEKDIIPIVKEMMIPEVHSKTDESSHPVHLRPESSEKRLNTPHTDSPPSSSLLNHPAFRAVILLVVAVAVLLCLYQYKSSPISPKSQ